MLIHSHEIIWCIRRTQYITSIGLNYKNMGILLGGVLDS